MGLTRSLEPTPAPTTSAAPPPIPGSDRRASDAVLGLLMLAFDGFDLPDDMAARLASSPAAGITLFRFLNVSSAPQVRTLTATVQAAARRRDSSAPPLLIAADQEGGQFLALGDDAT